MKNKTDEYYVREAAILEALPGTAKEVQDKTKLPQPTVSKHLQRLMLANRAYHAGWTKQNNCEQLVMTFERGPKPPGYEPPRRSGRRWQEAHAQPAAPSMIVQQEKKPEKPPGTSVEEWDAQCERLASGSGHWHRKPDPIPPPHPLMMMYGVVKQDEKPLDAAWPGDKIKE